MVLTADLRNQIAASQFSPTDDDPALLAELFVAIRLFDLPRLEAVLASGGVSSLDVVFKGVTPLNYACRHKEGLPVVQRLLRAGASVHFHDRRTGSFPLHKAIGAGSVDLLRHLLDAGAAATVADRLGQTPLHFVANVNGVDQAALLLERGADVNARSSSGMTPLHVASKLGHVELARMFLESGAVVDAMDVRRKATPLRNAVDHWCTDIVELLLKHGADANVQAYGSNPLLEAANEGHVHIVKLLTAAGAKVDCRHMTTGETPLIRAAAGGHVKVVQYLIDELDADVNATDGEGQTALIRAIEMNHKSVVDFLIQHQNINLNAKTTHGHWTALHCAINYTNHHCNEWSIRDLLRAGADPDSALANGQTCLHLAAQLNVVHAAPVARMLLQHGAKAEASDVEGWTPLMLAARFRNNAVLNLLLDAAVSISAADLRFFQSDDAFQHFLGRFNDDDEEDEGEAAAAAAAAAVVATPEELASWRALQERVSTPPLLAQLARRSIRQTVRECRGRPEMRQSIEMIDRETLPKVLRDYLLML